MPKARGPVQFLCWFVLLAALAAQAEEPSSSDRDPAVLMRRVVALCDESKFDDVEPLLATLARLHAASDARAVAVLYAAQQAYASGNRERAIKWLEPLASQPAAKHRVIASDALVWCSLDPAELKIPSTRLLELADQNPDSSFAPIALRLRAERLAQAKQPDEALFVYHALLARYPKSRCVPSVLLATARLHGDLQQNREALTWLKRLVEEFPQDESLDAALYLGVFSALDAKEESLSQQWLDRIVADHSHSEYWPDAAYRRAERHLAAGEHEPAQQLAAKAIESGIATPKLKCRARFLCVQVAVTKSDWPLVERSASELLAAKPGEPLQTLALFWQAESAYRRGERKLARERFLDLSLLIAGREEDWLGIVPLRLAQLEAQQQRWTQALELADLVARERPSFSRMYEVDYLRGRCFTAQAKFPDARESFARVVVSENGSGSETAAMAQWMIGETYFLQKSYEEAIAAYEKTLSSEHPEWKSAALLQAAKCCERLARWDEAVQRYERIATELGETRYLTEAKTRLAAARQRLTAAKSTPTASRR